MELKSLALGQSHWRASCSGRHRQIRRQQNTLSYQKDKRQRSKLRLMPSVKVASTSHGQFNCDVCSRIYVSRIGDEICNIDGSLHHQDRLTYDIDRVSNTRPQAYDTEPLDLEKTSWEENTYKIHIPFYCHWYPNLSRIFSRFPTGVELQHFNTWYYTPSGTY